MQTRLPAARAVKPATALLIAACCLALTGFGEVEKKKPSDSPVPLTVPNLSQNCLGVMGYSFDG